MRRIPLSRRSHVTGFQPVGARAVDHESALERDFVTLTRFQDGGVTITSQPVTIKFQDNGRARRYTPDFLVKWSDGRTELVEVKYHAELCANWSHLQPRFLAAQAWSAERGIQFRVATERELRGPILDNAMRLLPLTAAPVDERLAACAIEAARSHLAPTFGSVAGAVPGDRSTALGVVWRLIARGVLRVDLAAPVGLETPVRP